MARPTNAAASKLSLRIVAALLTLAVALPGCGKQVKSPISYNAIPTPTLAEGVINLTVAHVVNPRFEKFSDAQLAAFLDALRTASSTHFGRDIEFGAIETYTISEYFQPVPAFAHAWRKQYIYDFKSGKGDRAKLEEAYAESIRHQTTAAKDWSAFAAREIGLEKNDADLAAWKKRFADTHLQRLGLLASIRASDGRPVIDESPYNEWMYWGALGESDRAHDVIITNQLVASVETDSVDIHSALRGGLTVGTTDFSTKSRFGTHFWWSTFAHTSNDPVIVKMRGGEIYEPLEAARLAGTGAAHELGHVLFHYGHPFGVSTCLMSPTPMLRFREHLSKLDPAACRAAQDPAMKSGAFNVVRPIYAGGS